MDSLLPWNLVNIISVPHSLFLWKRDKVDRVDNPISLMPQENTCRVKVMGERSLNILNLSLSLSPWQEIYNQNLSSPSRSQGVLIVKIVCLSSKFKNPGLDGHSRASGGDWTCRQTRQTSQVFDDRIRDSLYLRDKKIFQFSERHRWSPFFETSICVWCVSSLHLFPSVCSRVSKVNLIWHFFIDSARAVISTTRAGHQRQTTSEMLWRRELRLSLQKLDKVFYSAHSIAPVNGHSPISTPCHLLTKPIARCQSTCVKSGMTSTIPSSTLRWSASSSRGSSVKTAN